MSSKTDEVRAALRKLIDQEGASCLKDAKRFRSLWLDYVPSQSNEARLILSAVQEGVGGVLLNAVDQDEAGQRQSIRRCEQRLTDAYITEDGARFAVREIASAMQIDVDRVAPLPVSDSGTEQQAKNSQANSSVPEQSPKSQVKDSDSGREKNTRQEQEPSRREDDRSYEEFLANNAAKDAPAKQKKKNKFPVLLLLFLLIGGVAAGLFLSRGSSVPDPVPPVDVQNTEDDLSGVVPPILPVEPPEEEPEEEPAENENLAGVVPPVLPAETEEPTPAETETPAYEIDTIVSNLEHVISMVMDDENTVYYISGDTVYSSNSDRTISLSSGSDSYLVYDPYNAILYLLTNRDSGVHDPAIYDITEYYKSVDEIDELTPVLDSENCPALVTRFTAVNSNNTASQVGVLKNGALLVPGYKNGTTGTYMVNIEQKTVTPTENAYGQYHTVVEDSVVAFNAVNTAKATISTFDGTSREINFERAYPFSPKYSRHGTIYCYDNSYGVCCYNLDGTVTTLIPQEDIQVKDYQSLNQTHIVQLAVGTADCIAFYDAGLECIRMIQPTSSATE